MDPMADPALTTGPPTCFCSGNLIRRMSDGKCISEDECQAQAGFQIRFYNYYITYYIDELNSNCVSIDF